MSTVLITGASRGFGKELLKVFLTKKWTVFPLIRNPDPISDVVSQYKSLCYPIIADITFECVELAIETVLQKVTNSLDVLINNAGSIKKKRGIWNTSSDDLKSHFDVHCLGAFHCTKAALPFLTKAVNPVVVNITSRWGSIGRTANGNGNTIYGYNIAKAAQNMLTACLHHELKPSNIKVFAIHPGRLLTSAGAADADTPPELAAEKLYQWLKHVDDNVACKCYDLINDSEIEW